MKVSSTIGMLTLAAGLCFAGAGGAGAHGTPDKDYNPRKAYSDKIHAQYISECEAETRAVATGPGRDFEAAVAECVSARHDQAKFAGRLLMGGLLVLGVGGCAHALLSEKRNFKPR